MDPAEWFKTVTQLQARFELFVGAPQRLRQMAEQRGWRREGACTRGPIRNQFEAGVYLMTAWHYGHDSMAVLDFRDLIFIDLGGRFESDGCKMMLPAVSSVG